MRDLSLGNSANGFQITSLVKTVALFVLAYLLTACARSILSVPGLSDEQQFRIEFPWLRIQDLHYQGRHPVFFGPRCQVFTGLTLNRVDSLAMKGRK
jgi:hypothetical protein